MGLAAGAGAIRTPAWGAAGGEEGGGPPGRRGRGGGGGGGGPAGGGRRGGGGTGRRRWRLAGRRLLPDPALQAAREVAHQAVGDVLDHAAAAEAGEAAGDREVGHRLHPRGAA